MLIQVQNHIRIVIPYYTLISQFLLKNIIVNHLNVRKIRVLCIYDFNIMIYQEVLYTIKNITLFYIYIYTHAYIHVSCIHEYMNTYIHVSM